MITVFDFYAKWCEPCRKLAPYLDELEKKYTQIKFKKVNIEKEPDLSETFDVHSLPTVIIYDDVKKEVLSRIIGFNLPLILSEIDAVALL